MAPYKIDLSLNKTKTNKEYLLSYINQHKTLTDMIAKVQKKMIQVNKDTGEEFFKDFKIKEGVTINYKKIKLDRFPAIDTTEKIKEYKKLTQKTKIFKQIRDSLMNNLKDLDRTSAFCKDKLSTIVLLIFLEKYVKLFSYTNKYYKNSISLKIVLKKLMK